jgi:hypothetical protein
MTSDRRSIMELIHPSLIKKINRTENYVRLTNGSIIYVMGAFKPDSIRGAEAEGVLFSEYSHHDSDAAWSNIFLPIISASKGWAGFISTPNGPNFYHNLYMGAVYNPGWYVSLVKNSETKIVSPEAIQELIDTGQMSEDMVKQEFECDFNVKSIGSFFGDLIRTARDEGRIGKFEHDPNKKVDTYWDLGIRDDTVVWFVQRDGSRYVIIDYYEDSSKPLRTYYEAIMSRTQYRYRCHVLPHDGTKCRYGVNENVTTAGMLEELLKEDTSGRSGVVITSERPKRKMDAILGTRAIFHSFYFNESAMTKGIRKLELYKRKFVKTSRTFSSEPVHDENSHAADALMNIFLAKERLSTVVGSAYGVPAPQPYKLSNRVDIWD